MRLGLAVNLLSRPLPRCGGHGRRGVVTRVSATSGAPQAALPPGMGWNVPGKVREAPRVGSSPLTRSDGASPSILHLFSKFESLLKQNRVKMKVTHSQIGRADVVSVLLPLLWVPSPGRCRDRYSERNGRFRRGPESPGGAQPAHRQITGLSYLFIYFWLHWVFLAARGLSAVVASRGYSLLQCAGFSLRWLLLLRSTGSRYTGFSSCGSRAQ